ncbi:MAG: hypothetical protein J6K58_11915 [Lachnospiraceae bacterium]|nr:hypothetical protein [Lachnospiraceae bacterium]
MESNRMCPKCSKKYSGDVSICEKCGEVLIEVSKDFELARSIIREPVLLGSDEEVDMIYVKEALDQRRIPYFTEETHKAVPTGSSKMGSMNILTITNIYVNKSDLEEADRAFAQAKEEMEFDLSLPVQYIDMPEGFEEENEGDENTKEKGKGWYEKLIDMFRL